MTSIYKQRIDSSVSRWQEEYTDCINSKDPETFFLQHFNQLSVLNIEPFDCVNNRLITFNVAAGITCDFKCCPHNHQLCHNEPLRSTPVIVVQISEIVKQYLSQQLSTSLTLQGLEPLDNMDGVLWLLWYFRRKSKDPIFIWTGYEEEEVATLIGLVRFLQWKSIFLKMGRYRWGEKPHYDENLGVFLASPNQYCKKIF